MERLTVGVGGMTCANCATTVGDALESVAGVASATANFAADEATVEYNPAETEPTALVTAIREAGYEPVTAETTVGIMDMTCANCSQTVERAVGDLDGVVRVDANFAADEARVEYLADTTDRSTVEDAIVDAGYTPVREEDGDGASEADRREAARTAEIRHQRNLTLLGVVVSLPLLAFMADHLLFDGTLLPETVAGVGTGWVSRASHRSSSGGSSTGTATTRS